MRSMYNIREAIAELAFVIFIKLSERSTDMMALFFAQRVILQKCDFKGTNDPDDKNDVPPALKPAVAGILINECGLPELVPVEYGGTKED